MAPKSVTFRRHDHLVSVRFGDLLMPFLQHYIFNVFVSCMCSFADFACHSYQHNILEMFLSLCFCDEFSVLAPSQGL